MTAGGSQQLRIWRRARRDGATLMTACAQSGIPLAEARLWDAEDRKNPPPPDAYELLTTAPVGAPPEKEDDMGRPKKSAAISGEVPKPDYALAVKLYRDDIRPAMGTVGEGAQEMSTAYKAIKRQAHIQPQAARAAFRLVDMEEAKRDDYLRSFNGLLKELKIFMPSDLVDAAEGKSGLGDSVVPTGERPRPKLVTIPAGPADGSDSDLAGEELPPVVNGEIVDHDPLGIGADEHPQAAE